MKRYSPRMRASRLRRMGFTLIEVMVAMTMFALVGTLVYSGFSQTARAKKTLDRQLDRYHELRMAMERMVRELSMAYMTTHLNLSPSLQGLKTTFIGKGSGFGDRIDFTAVSHTRVYRDAKESDQEELSYFVADSPDGKTKVLARRMQSRIDDKPQEGGRVEVLLGDVLEFELEYLDSVTWEWVKDWDAVSGQGQQNRLPTQVKIKLTIPSIANPEKKETYLTRAVLPMNWALNHANY